jgi:serine/threonine protein kinase
LVLVDFGLAMAKPKKDSAASGYTDLFSPPEQIRGGAPLIPETDFYSLGMTLIYPPKRFGLTSTEQRNLSLAIKRARFMALIPYVVK